MICKSCQQTIPEESELCPLCGAPQAETGAEQPAGPEEEPAKDGTKRQKLLWIAAGVCIALCAVLFLCLLNGAKKARYEAALTLEGQKRYAESRDAFLAMDGYADAAEHAQMDGMYLKFEEGMALLQTGDPENAEKAMEIFNGLGSIEGSTEAAEKCSEIIEYQKGGFLFSAGRFRDAGDLFTGLGDYLNSGDLAAECYAYDAAEQAGVLLEQGNYDEAADLFRKAQKGGAGDFSKEIDLCGKEAAYAEAEQELAAGNNYAAYKKFLPLMEFKGALGRAQACAVDYPEDGEYYRNPAVDAKGAQLTIPNTENDPFVIKIYRDDGMLLDCVFVNAKSKVRVKVPLGTYTMKKASGSTWFGEQDLFGDGGYYEELFIGGFPTKDYTFKGGRIYTLVEGILGLPVEREGF